MPAIWMYSIPCVHWTPSSWWRHQIETFSALLAICAGNSPVTGEYPAQRPVTLSFDVFFVLRLNKRLSKQSWGRWFKTPSRPLWRHCNVSLSQASPKYAYCIVLCMGCQSAGILSTEPEEQTTMKLQNNNHVIKSWSARYYKHAYSYTCIKITLSKKNATLRNE